jgi:hypothetical protein
MKVAIMQPYLFPYLGYFQLIHSVDTFVFYDDVNYIKNGWIDRNRILVNGAPSYFKVPLVEASSFKLIDEIEINYSIYDRWLNTLNKTIDHSYKKSKYYERTKSLMFDVLGRRYSSIAELAMESTVATMNCIGVKTEFCSSRSKHSNTKKGRQDRLIEICTKEEASVYINPIGGADLYSHEDFIAKGIQLMLLSPTLSPYSQKSKEFIPGLSIIDVLMNEEPAHILNLLRECKITTAQ